MDSSPAGRSDPDIVGGLDGLGAVGGVGPLADLDGLDALTDLDARIAGCRACPRLVAWREEVARTRRAAFADQTYWGRPVPGYGPADASLLVVGLAPPPTAGTGPGSAPGDRSGDVLYAALHDVGLASRGTSVSADDGLELYGVRVTSPVHCAPHPADQADTWRTGHLPPLARESRELELLRPMLRSVVVLGAFGWPAALLPAFAAAGWTVPRPRPVFAHGARVSLGAQDGSAAGSVELFGCFHVSQRNAFTGRLTPAMLRDVLRAAAGAAGLTTRPYEV